MVSSAKQLDQFFTQDGVATDSLDVILKILKQLDYTPADNLFIEPSAGEGAFIRAFKKSDLDYLAYDIDVKQPYVAKLDFLQQGIPNSLPDKDKVIVIGNPPFGKRARLAIDFINKSFEYSDTVAFILPLQFDKYSAQKRINPFANLVYNQRLNDNSFVYEGKEYAVRCCLQVWTKRDSLPDKRLRQPPQINHRDFEMWQYNNTREAEKFFDKDRYKWDFAVPRQGYKDYSIKETDPDNMDRRTQWIFFRASNNNILHNLMKLDFNKLSHKNTSTPGFGKADVVQAYEEMFHRGSISDTSTETQTFQLGDPNPNLAETLPLPLIL